MPKSNCYYIEEKLEAIVRTQEDESKDEQEVSGK